jgi:hypothetical protein
MPFFTRAIALHVDGHVIKTKAEHPFYTSNGWVDAYGLRVGDLLRTRQGSWATVQAVEVVEAPVHQLVPRIIPYPTSELLTAGTPIPTSTDLKPIEEINVGDFVIVPDPDRN